ncbi:MLO-like protein 1 isoform X2 [Quercus lobata]|uniref:MLO-like protein 1 isoform X2 n=1 Tax=Quercus lobata TaxID=97700 RepID=UPI001243E8CF|nr:MLO-like protein 1 isoform X2 [Quercus lobata]
MVGDDGRCEYLKKKNQKPLFHALEKIKEELMLLGFISLLLSVFQSEIEKLCISENLANQWLPCKLTDASSSSSSSTTTHFQTLFTSFIPRRLLAKATITPEEYCAKMGGKVPLLSFTALHHLHIFIFVLAVAHVNFCALTILFGGAKIRQWKHWEENDPEEVLKTYITQVQDHTFFRKCFLGIGKDSTLLGWVQSFFKQFYGSLTKTDYLTMRRGFLMTHCRGNPEFNFHNYMIRALEADFSKVVGISWYLWLFVVIFLLLNVAGWNAYFWIAFIPFILLLAVGTKLEHVIIQLAHEVAEKHTAIVGDLVVKPSDDHFWFHRPRIVLLLIHIILFQNSFELAFFFWIWVQYGFDSCIMGKINYIIPRLVIGVFVQFICSYSTLPLYAIVTQMGSSFKKAIFEEHNQEGLVGWAQTAKKNRGLRKAANGSTTTTSQGSTTHASSQMSPKETTPLAIQMSEVSAMEEGNAGEIAAATLYGGHR